MINKYVLTFRYNFGHNRYRFCW